MQRKQVAFDGLWLLQKIVVDFPGHVGLKEATAITVIYANKSITLHFRNFSIPAFDSLGYCANDAIELIGCLM